MLNLSNSWTPLNQVKTQAHRTFVASEKMCLQMYHAVKKEELGLPTVAEFKNPT
jgi:hypothetical protein